MEQQYRDMAVGSIFDTTSTTQKNQIGRRVRLDDGRVFRYARNYNLDLTIGQLVINLVNETDIAATYFGADTATAPVAGEGGAVGDTKIALCDLTTGLTINEYQQGYLCITDGTGEGYMYKVASNDPGVTSGKHNVRIYDGLVAALSNSSVGTLVRSPWYDVNYHTAADYNNTATQMCVGRTVCATTSGTNTRAEYLWVQTWGPCLVRAGEETFIQGAPVQLSQTDNGRGGTPIATENRVQVIGVGMEATADDVWGPVFLQICP